MKKAVIYGRVSTKDKQDYSRQLHDLNRYATANQYRVVESFTEKVSGAKRTDQRPEYLRMLAYLKSNPDVKHILVTELSRFGRLGTKTKMAIEELAESGINIYFQDRGIHTVKDGKPNSDAMLIVGILCDFAKKELETLQQRIKSGLSFSANNGGAGGGAVKAYGFKNENRKLVIDQDESKVVREIFNLYHQGLGGAQIAAHLNSKGVETRYQKVFAEQEVKTKSGLIRKGKDYSWSDATIIGILKNPIYKGERRYNNEVLKVDSIVDATLFDQVQLKIKNRNNRPIRTIENDNYLKGLIKCGTCGQPYYMHKRKDNRDAAYKCLSRKYQYAGKMDYCGTPSIGIDKLLNSLMVAFNQVIVDQIKKNKTHSDIKTKIELKQIEIKNAKSQIKNLETKMDGLLDAFALKTFSQAQITKKNAEYKNEFEKLTLTLSERLSELSELESLKKKRPLREQYNKEDFKKNIKDVVKQIVISKSRHKSQLKSCYPVKNDPLTQVTIESIFGATCVYVLSRYSNTMSLLGTDKTHSRAIKTLPIDMSVRNISSRWAMTAGFIHKAELISID